MPKQLGFDLYAMIVHYKDGTVCNCYARKTDNWYYFSDKMDFRIQLAGDNRTITLQQWRRIHYSSSWYESGLLDYVELMVFGETYLQSELNPMRDDISTNHTDIVNNYNEFNTFVSNTYNPAIALLQQEITSLHDYVIAMEKLINIKLGNLFNNWSGYAEYANNTSDSIRLLAKNYNNFVENVIAAFSHVWGELDGSYGVKVKVDGFNVRGVMTDSGGSEITGRELVDYANITEGETKLIEIHDDRQEALVDYTVGTIGNEIHWDAGGAGRQTMQEQINDLDAKFNDYVTQQQLKGAIDDIMDIIAGIIAGGGSG